MIIRKLFPIALFNKVKYNQSKLVTRQDLTKLNLLQLDSRILKQSTLCTCQYKTRKQTTKLGRKLEIIYVRNRLFDLTTGNETTLTTQHHNMTYPIGNN